MASSTLWRKAVLSINASVSNVIQNLDSNAIKIALVVTDSGLLEGTISDGDVRRGLLKGLTMDSPITSILHRNPLVVPPELERGLVLQLMLANKIQQIPVVNDQRKVVGLHLWDEINVASIRQNSMVIMAGGMGARLRPHTENCPKPLLPLAGKPMLEHIIERAKAEGFKNFIISLGYLGYKIEDYFCDGSRFGVEIQYLREDIPLGTAGALSLIGATPEESFIVSNGDVITDIRYGELLDFHLRQGAEATMAVRLHEWQHPFGVVHTNGVEIVGFEEKPIARTHINAGIYALNPSSLKALNKNERCDMPTLFERLQINGLRTVAYPMHEPWLDVGRPADLITADKALDLKSGANHVDNSEAS